MPQVPINREKQRRLILDYISRMPSLSTTVTKVLKICDNPTTSPNDLNRVISLDPVLTGRVLNLINSAYYSLPNKITSLTRAIIMLGLNTVKNLALSTAIMENIGGRGACMGFSMDDFWVHSICVGVTSKSLATLKGIPVAEREEYFVAGLVHDLGKLPLANLFPDEYARALKVAKLEQGPLYVAEHRTLQLDHGMVGRMIAEKWGLGEALIDSLHYHHNPDEVKEKNSQLVAITALANVYANIFEIGSAGDLFPQEPMVFDLLEKVAISWSKLSGLGENVLEEIENAKIFLKVTKKS